MGHKQDAESTPFHYLRRLESAVLSNFWHLPTHETSSLQWSGLSFLAGSYILLIPLSEVVEIMRVPFLAQVPGVKFWLRGMATCRGELFPVTDLNGFLTQKISVITQYSRILVVSYHEEYSGIIVDKVLGLQRIANENRKNVCSQLSPELSPFIVGAFVNEHLELPIMSSQLLLQNPRFRDVAVREL